MRFTGLASVLSMVLGVSLGGIARGGDCGCTAAAPAAAAPCGQQYVTQDVCVPEMVTEERTCTRDGVRSGNPHSQGRVLRNGSRHEDGSLHLYGHGSPRAKADGDLLRGRARDAASDRNLSGPGADLQDGDEQLYGLRSGLDRQDGAVYGFGAGLRNPPGHALRDALRAGQGDADALRR